MTRTITAMLTRAALVVGMVVAGAVAVVSVSQTEAEVYWGGCLSPPMVPPIMGPLILGALLGFLAGTWIPRSKRGEMRR